MAILYHVEKHKKKVTKKKYVVGIDEVGRGPLAGPVTVCAVVMEERYYRIFCLQTKGFLRDSKKLSKQKREQWHRDILQWKKDSLLATTIKSFSAKQIDHRGISVCLKMAVASVLKQSLVDPKRTKVYLDGSLYAPDQYLKQETIIKGDEKVPVISLASIYAKVTRDRYMKALSKQFPEYGFEVHMGYGTLKHRQAIKNHGSSSVHRQSFIKGIVDVYR